MSNGREPSRRRASGPDSEDDPSDRAADSEDDPSDRAESGDVAYDEAFDEPYPEDEPAGDELGPDDVPSHAESDSDEGAKSTDDGEQRTDQDRWRRVAWVTVISLILGVAWALTLSTILLNRSGDRTAELISLFESGQEERTATLARLPESQAERRATIEGLQEQSQLFKAQTLSAFADQSESNAGSRQAIASAALAEIQRRKALTSSAERTLLTEQIGTIADLQSSIDRLRTSLTESMRKLRESIKDLGPRP